VRKLIICATAAIALLGFSPAPSAQDEPHHLLLRNGRESHLFTIDWPGVIQSDRIAANLKR
jgi:hypothetical protein